MSQKSNTIFNNKHRFSKNVEEGEPRILKRRREDKTKLITK